MSLRSTIGDAAGQSGVAIETIRYYERIGLVPPPRRTSGNYRSYEPAHIRRLGFIRRARELGFSLDEVRALLDLATRPEQSCAAVDAVARAHLADVERKIADLERLRRELGGLLQQCRAGTIDHCRIVEALATEPSEAVATLD